MKREWLRPFFVVAALYDIVLGGLFLVAPGAIYARFGVTPANHPAYVQFAAAVVLIFGIGFWFVARSPERNRDVIKLGVLFKIAYSGGGPRLRWFRGECGMFVPFAWIDLAFIAAFLAALRSLPAGQAARALIAIIRG
jgi:hypothetical protein